MENLQVEATLVLKYTKRWDEEARVFVADIPAIDVKTQACTEENLRCAVTSAARMYLQVCADKGLLRRIGRE